MTYRDLSDADLVDFAKSLEKKLAAHEVTCLDNALADSLAAGLTPLNNAFETVIEKSVESTATTKAINADKRSQRDVIEDRISKVQSFIDSTDGTAKDYELCGFNAPKPRSSVVPNDPSNLTAVGTSNGVNTLTFEGNNKSGGVTYEIWRRKGDEGEWGIIGTTKKQAFEDKPVTPGQYYEYKIQAVAAKSKSNFSNSAVVYGAP